MVPTGASCNRCGLPSKASVRVCARCCDWDDSLSHVRSVFEFEGPVRDAIHALKFGGEYARAEWCADLMSQMARTIQWISGVLVPVPLHRSRLEERGYNQSERIARELSRLLELECRQFVERHRATRSQVGLDATARQQNVSGAFTASPDVVGLDVLLIDDVATTGATLHACATALIDAGASRVRALTLATATSIA